MSYENLSDEELLALYKKSQTDTPYANLSTQDLLNKYQIAKSDSLSEENINAKMANMETFIKAKNATSRVNNLIHELPSMIGSGVGIAAGGVVGQTLIPIPGVGAAIGATIGGGLGGASGKGYQQAITGEAAKKPLGELYKEQAKEALKGAAVGGAAGAAGLVAPTATGAVIAKQAMTSVPKALLKVGSAAARRGLAATAGALPATTTQELAFGEPNQPASKRIANIVKPAVQIGAAEFAIGGVGGLYQTGKGAFYRKPVDSLVNDAEQIARTISESGGHPKMAQLEKERGLGRKLWDIVKQLPLGGARLAKREEKNLARLTQAAKGVVESVRGGLPAEKVVRKALFNERYNQVWDTSDKLGVKVDTMPVKLRTGAAIPDELPLPRKQVTSNVTKLSSSEQAFVGKSTGEELKEKMRLLGRGEPVPQAAIAKSTEEFTTLAEQYAKDGLANGFSAPKARALAAALPESLSAKEAHGIKSILQRAAKRTSKSDKNAGRILYTAAKDVENATYEALKVAEKEAPGISKALRRTDKLYRKDKVAENLESAIGQIGKDEKGVYSYIEPDTGKPVLSGDRLLNYLKDSDNKAELLKDGLHTRHYNKLVNLARATQQLQTSAGRGAGVTTGMQISAVTRPELGTTARFLLTPLVLSRAILNRPYILSSEKAVDILSRGLKYRGTADKSAEIIALALAAYNQDTEQDLGGVNQ